MKNVGNIYILKTRSDRKKIFLIQEAILVYNLCENIEHQNNC